MAILIPNLAWYTALSKRKEMLPRCPFASVYRCPRYYQSVSLLGEGAGGTSIDPAEDTRLLEHWRGSDLWPVTTEQATSTFGPQGSPDIFSNFCPEVTSAASRSNNSSGSRSSAVEPSLHARLK